MALNYEISCTKSSRAIHSTPRPELIQENLFPMLVLPGPTVQTIRPPTSSII